MTATRNDQKSLKSNLAEQGPSTHDNTANGLIGLNDDTISNLKTFGFEKRTKARAQHIQFTKRPALTIRRFQTRLIQVILKAVA